jgi:hypothetical protein
MTVVSNTSPVVKLAAIGRLNLLQQLYATILSIIVALAAIAALVPVAVGRSQTQGQAPVSFKATVTGPTPELFEIPVSPPVFSLHETGTGQADQLGAFRWTGHAMQSGGADLMTPRPLSEGIGVMKAASGDAIFFRYSGKVIVGIDSQNKELAFEITGGQGKFLGATGSGLFRDVVDFNRRQLTRTVEGVIAVPAAK